MKRYRFSAAVILVAFLCSSPPAQVPDFYDLEVVRDIHLTFHQPDWWQQLERNYSSATPISADLRVDNDDYPSVGVRFRGLTSHLWLPPGAQKMSFNIRTNHFESGQRVQEYTNINLKNGFHDPTFLREVTSHWIMRRHGVGPKANFVRLHLNGVYWGIYVNLQQPNSSMMAEWYRSDHGNRYRADPVSNSWLFGRSALNWLGPDVKEYLSAYDAKQGDGLDLLHMIGVLNHTPASQLPVTLPSVFNVDSFLRYAAVMVAVSQLDCYIGSGRDYFLYHDPDHGDFHTITFDLNESLGGEGTTPLIDPWINSTNPELPALSRILIHPPWRERYKAHLRAIVEETVNRRVLIPFVRRLHAMIAPDVARDDKKLYTTQQFQDNLTQTVTLFYNDQNHQVLGLERFVEQKEDFLGNHRDLIAPRAWLEALSHGPLHPGPSDPVQVRVEGCALAEEVTLYWRHLGPFQAVPMQPSGKDGPALVWVGVIPAQPARALVDYYVEARTSGGAATYLPFSAEHRASGYQVFWSQGTSPVRINEFLASNRTGIRDEANEYSDWIELYNDSDQVADVAGMWLTDQLSRGPRWQIPPGTGIHPRSTLLIWASGEPSRGPLHADFALARAGEDVGLFDTDGQTLLDSITFGPQLPDVSMGRLFDGGLPWATFSKPTPRLRNELATCGTRRYGALDPASHSGSFALTGVPGIGLTPDLQVNDGPYSGVAALFLALRPEQRDLGLYGLPGKALLLDPVGFMGFALLGLDASGGASLPLPIPPDPFLVGGRLYLQAVVTGGVGIGLTNALEVILCP